MSSQFARLRGALDRVGTTTPGTVVGVFAEDLTAIMNHYVEVVREAAELKAATAAPQQAEAVPPGYVLVPIDVLQAASESLGNFVSDHGWTDADMQAMDNLDAAIAQQKGQP